MSGNLSGRELEALAVMAAAERSLSTLGHFPRGIGAGTLERLVRRGLAEQGGPPGRRDQVAWRITSAGLEALTEERRLTAANDDGSSLACC